MKDWVKGAALLISVITGSIIILGVVGTIIYISLFTEQNLNLDITTIVSVVLAIFSILLSVMFYLEATRTSNKFYDSTYRFMKDQSNLVKEMNAGFGERFKNFEQSLKDVTKNVHTRKENDDELELLLEEKNKLVDELMNRVDKKANDIGNLEKQLSNNEKLISELQKEAKVNNDKLIKSIQDDYLHSYKRNYNIFDLENIEPIDGIDSIDIFDLQKRVHKALQERNIKEDLELEYVFRTLRMNKANKATVEAKNKAGELFYYWLINTLSKPNKKDRNYVLNEIESFYNHSIKNAKKRNRD